MNFPPGLFKAFPDSFCPDILRYILSEIFAFLPGHIFLKTEQCV